MSEHKISIPARVYNAAVGGHVCGSEDVDFGQKVVHLIKYDRAGNEVSFESQVTQANKIYVIHDDFTLSSNVNIPANCVLEFDGGSISGEYALIGNNTKVIAPQNSKIFHTIDISGTWNVSTVYVDWFDVSEVVGFDNTPIIINAFNLTNDNVQNTIVFPNKTLYITSHVTLSPEPEHLYLFKINSNTDVILNSHLKLNVTDKHHYHIFTTYGNKNINITGSGSITGDLEEHQVVVGQQYGYGIVACGTNITISNITINKCIGDGIYINGYEFSKNIKIDKVTVDTNRRNGITLEICDNVEICNCIIKNTGTVKGDNPKRGINFEPFSYVHELEGRVFRNISIHNNVFNNNIGGDILLALDGMNMDSSGENIYIKDNVYFDTNGGIITINACSNVEIANEKLRRLVFIKPHSKETTNVKVVNCDICSVTTNNLDANGVKDIKFLNCTFNYKSEYAAILTNGINTDRNFRYTWNNVEFYDCEFNFQEYETENSITVSDPKLNSDEHFYRCSFNASPYSILHFFGIGTFDSCYFNCAHIIGTLYKADNKSIISNCTFDTKEENVIFRIYGNSDVTLNQGSTVDVYNNISLKHNGGQIMYIDSTSASYIQNCRFRLFGNKDLGYGEFNPSVLYEGSLSMDIESFGNKKLNGKPSHPVIGDTSFENGIPIWWNGTDWVDATGN